MAFRWFLLLDSACAGHAVEDPMRSGIMRNLNFARTDFSSFSEKEVEGVIFYGGMKEDSLLDKILKKIQRHHCDSFRSKSPLSQAQNRWFKHVQHFNREKKREKKNQWWPDANYLL